MKFLKGDLQYNHQTKAHNSYGSSSHGTYPWTLTPIAKVEEHKGALFFNQMNDLD